MSTNKGTPQAEDPRIVELKDINTRLKTVTAYLKAKHTPQSIEATISTASMFLDDHTPTFITMDNTSFEGTRHVGSLMKICEALEVKVGLGKSGKNVLNECATLLEKKMQLLKDVYGV